MRILIAEDDPLLTCSFQFTLPRWGYEIVAVADGTAAWNVLQEKDPPRLAILDWMMPGMTGLEVCKRIRAQKRLQPPYIVLLTARDRVEDIVSGLHSGANDYITKPFIEAELQARLDVGKHVVELQARLADRVSDLEEALARVKQLQGLLPICCYCKRIRSDQDYWQQVETYLSRHADVRFSHAICPECYHKEVEPQLRAATKDAET
jgi:sigma-B regulation protein RsbU (phosphoserine phosphatase)